MTNSSVVSIILYPRIGAETLKIQIWMSQILQLDPRAPILINKTWNNILSVNNISARITEILTPKEIKPHAKTITVRYRTTTTTDIEKPKSEATIPIIAILKPLIPALLMDNKAMPGNNINQIVTTIMANENNSLDNHAEIFFQM